MADPTPLALKPRVSSRAGRPLPPGPYPVPISTLDWLLSREDLAARYVALRDILGRGEKDLERRKAFREIPRDPWVRDVLVLLRRALSPGSSSAGLSRPYDGALWQTIFLLESGLDRTVPELARAADVLWAAWQRSFVQIERDETPAEDPALLLTVCRALALLGPADDPRLLSAAAWFAQRRLRSADAPRGGPSAVPELRFLTAIPPGRRIPLVSRALDFAVERTLATELPPAAPVVAAGAPAGRTVDLLETLGALSEAGVERRAELEPSLAHLAARADHRGRWKLERGLDAPTWIERERVGELSRWVTIKALGVLSRFTGLTMTGSR